MLQYLDDLLFREPALLHPQALSFKLRENSSIK